MDNASTDGTPEIAQRFAAADPRFEYRRQPHNKGSMPNFRDCVEAATSPYFMWRAYDDTSDVNYIETLARLLDENPGAGLAVGRTLQLKRRQRIRTYAPRLAGEPEGAYRIRATLQAKAAWIYGLFRTDDIRREITEVMKGYPHVNGWDNLAILPFAASLRIVGTDETTFNQGFIERADGPQKGDFLDPDMMQKLRDDFYTYTVNSQARFADMGAALPKPVLWLYADRTYRVMKILNARWRKWRGEKPKPPTKKYD
jgi:glycosyltransferase involved in cell wall biosynthesis